MIDKNSFIVQLRADISPHGIFKYFIPFQIQWSIQNMYYAVLLDTLFVEDKR